MFFGMITGAGIFLIITLLGGVFYGKEAMGFGDVKLMGALGLYYGVSSILEISLLAFLFFNFPKAKIFIVLIYEGIVYDVC